MSGFFTGRVLKNRSNPKSIQYHLSQRNVLEWRQGFTGRYQWVGLAQATHPGQANPTGAKTWSS